MKLGLYTECFGNRSFEEMLSLSQSMGIKYLEIGTGSMTFADLSARKTDGECGLGELDLTLTGTQEDYNYDLECGVGNLDVGSDSYSGLGREKTISNKGADRKLDLECGMGNISVDFSGKEHRDLQIS